MTDRAQCQVERWEVFELSLQGPDDGNPFLATPVSARFTQGERTVRADGFYDGEGIYRVRFQPDTPGEWRYETESDRPELHGQAGAFTCAEPAADNHGPVRVRDQFHFACADGTPYFPIGTTCYAWTHQGSEQEEATLHTLRAAPFNKMRMCLFPKDYTYNRNEPELFPFERKDDGSFDFTRFRPAYFWHLERRIADLRNLGIEADLILFHPYDRWGFAAMGAEADDRYLRYVVARLAAYRNVWWSLANEYDLMEAKTLADWDRFFQIIEAADPYGRLRSIHNCHEFYDHRKPWVTHASVQRGELDQVRQWRERYGRPVVVDECGYEGDIEEGWGNLTARELVHRFWVGTCRGGYVGHGETYRHPDDLLWWSKGGVLRGQSPPRIAFLRQILEDGPGDGLTPTDDWAFHGARIDDRYFLLYLGHHQPAVFSYRLPDGGRYRADVLDTWEMTVAHKGTHEGRVQIDLPAKPFLAVRIERVP